jgi:hypothetical protein
MVDAYVFVLVRCVCTVHRIRHRHSLLLAATIFPRTRRFRNVLFLLLWKTYAVSTLSCCGTTEYRKTYLLLPFAISSTIDSIPSQRLLMSTASRMLLRSFIIGVAELANDASRSVYTKMNRPMGPKLTPVSPGERAELALDSHAFCIGKRPIGAVGVSEMLDGCNLLLDEALFGLGVSVFCLDGCALGLDVLTVFVFEARLRLNGDGGGGGGLRVLFDSHWGREPWGHLWVA